MLDCSMLAQRLARRAAVRYRARTDRPARRWRRWRSLPSPRAMTQWPVPEAPGMAGARGCGSCWAPICFRLEIAFPEIDVDTAVALGGGSPQLAGTEPHAVQRFSRRAATVSAGVGQRLDAVQAIDHAVLAATIARQSRMTARMNVAGDHAIPRLESRTRSVERRQRLRR